jgi:hypothetical protein
MKEVAVCVITQLNVICFKIHPTFVSNRSNSQNFLTFFDKAINNMGHIDETNNTVRLYSSVDLTLNPVPQIIIGSIFRTNYLLKFPYQRIINIVFLVDKCNKNLMKYILSLNYLHNSIVNIF